MFRTILVPVDLEHLEHSKELLRVAAQFASQEKADVHLLNVIYGPPAVVSQYLPADYEKKASADTKAKLERVAGAVEFGAGKVVCAVRHGNSYPEILDYSEEIKADLIVMASHRPGVADYLLGSTAARVVRHAACSVFVVRH